MVPVTVPSLLTARAEAEPGKIAIVVPGRGELTFGAWETRSNAVARGLLDRGLRPGDRVGLRFGGDWIGYAVAFCAVLKAGGTAVPISDRLPGPEVDDILARCSAVALLHGSSTGQGHEGQGYGTPGYEGPGDTASRHRWTAPVAAIESGDDAPVTVEVRPEWLAQIISTSGTTGAAKGVGASHANLAYGRAPAPARRPYAHSRFFLHAFPIGTNAAQMMLMDTLTAHPAALPMAGFDAAEFCRIVEAYQVGTVFLVPSMAIELLGSDARGRHDLSSVLLLSSSAAALPPSVAQDLAAAFPGATIVNYYTSTEAVPAQTAMILDPRRPSSLGRPTEVGDLRVCDADGDVLPPGEVGEVWLRSPAPPRSYVGDPESGATVFRDGWVRMGDLGRLDVDGYLYLVDRESDVIKSGALKVSTLRVEAALHEHPMVAEAAVVGVPHPVMGAVPAAAVRLSAPVPTQELRDFLTARLARHELPTRITVVESFTRNDAGKILKSAVRDLFAAAGRPVPLTAGQRALLARPEGSAGHVRVAMRVHDTIDLAVLRRALHDVAIRHEALRLTFPGDETRAEILPGLVPEIVYLPAGDDGGRGEPRSRRVGEPATELDRPFDVERGPLLRAVLADAPEGGSLLGLAAHPLICDDWSLDIVLQDLGTLYGAALDGREATLPPVVTGYADHVGGHLGEHLDAAAAGDDRAAATRAARAAREAPVLLAGGVPERGDRVLGPTTAARLRRAARSRRTTPARMALAAWAAALAALPGETPERDADVVVLLRSHGRPGPDLADVVGPLVLHVPVTVVPGPELAERVIAAAAEAEDEAHRVPGLGRPLVAHWGGHTGSFAFEVLRPEPYLPGLRAEPSPLPPAPPPDAPPCLTLVERPDGTLTGHCSGRSAEHAIALFERHLEPLLS
ncbi:AMP-binding protein [Microtetraspora sp. AC03309]|uniref:AMP-binding protein n=1 Tax=Microtetraspora sp. AC03309 TaxID=2779376 RepID=UPI001E44A3E3|nr:AMP-binding protein [Microtetraspora sp. AC03309]MCC5578783.1 AMP-binding protein [Microtetraspora sp. AC03309]